MRDGYLSPVRVYKPQHTSSAPSPLVVLLYGGAYMVGDNRQLAPYGLTLSSMYNATAVLPSYRLAPEHKFPTAQNDVWDSLLWLAQNGASQLGADLSAGFVMGGVSAGAALSASLGQLWVDQGQSPKLTGLWLCIPPIFRDIDQVPAEYRSNYLAREENSDADVIDISTLHWVEVHQEPDPTSPLYSPFNSPHPQKHRNLAEDNIRVYFQAAGKDPLRDDALVYEQVLKKHGVETRLDVYPGVSSVPGTPAVHMKKSVEANRPWSRSLTHTLVFSHS